MITLIEKIKKQLDTATPKLNRPIYQSKKIEKIADDYAIEFSNWLFNINKEVLAKQLKEFKKEKGL
jgi:hypothetical protein